MGASQSSLLPRGLREGSASANIAYLGGAWIVYRLGLALYNISPLHPLSHIPGPKLAAATLLYEAWFDVIKGGKFATQIGELHEQYGPVIRINPNEVHCADAQLLDDIYTSSGTRIRDKSPHMMAGLYNSPLGVSAFGTITHELHRSRRAAMAKYFTRSKMLSFEPDVAALIPLFCAKMLRQTEPFEAQEAFGCLTGDVIGQYAFGEANGFVEQEDWKPNWTDQTELFVDSVHLLKNIAPLRWISATVPYVSRWLPEEGMALLLKEMLITSPARVRSAMKDVAQGNERSNSVLCSILESDLPDSEKAPGRLAGEAFSMIVGGTETTAKTLSIITYHLLSNPDQLEELRGVLEECDMDDVDELSWTELEKIPYLEGVVLEGLRLSYGLAARGMRSARDEVLVYRSSDGKLEIPIPKGTPIGVSTTLLHHNEDIFVDSTEFDPERWTKASEAHRREMDRHLMSFSRGSRQCIGMNLAFCELYLITAAIALEVLPRMKLYETTEDDIKYDREYGVYLPRKGSKGVRLQVVA